MEWARENSKTDGKGEYKMTASEERERSRVELRAKNSEIKRGGMVLQALEKKGERNRRLIKQMKVAVAMPWVTGCLGEE